MNKPATLPAASTDGADAFARLQALTAPEMTRVEALIAERMRAAETDLIARVAAHLIGAGGKRLRPVLTLAAAKLFGYEGEHHVRLAAAVEFIHNATLLHDDVVDESDRRRGAPSANAVYGAKPSVLVGDFLFARSFQLMVETGSVAVLGVLSDAAATIVEGEVLQLSAARSLAGGEDVYFKVIRGKTAALFEAATRAGAMVADATDAQVAALATYGDALGVAFQLVDDLLDYGGASAAFGKVKGGDFVEGKATLPVLLAHARGDAEARAFWTRVIEKGDRRDGDLEEAVTRMRDTGALAATRERADACASRAVAALEGLPDAPVRAALADIAGFVTARAY